MRTAPRSPRRWARFRRTWLAGGVAATLATAGLVAATATPASADPATIYVTVGSDTTQDVMNAFAANVGGGLIGSWDAFNAGTPGVFGDTINPKANCHMTRPQGSGQGLNALRKSINSGTAAAQLADPPEPGCVDFSRSSSGPGTVSATGQLIYIPFALDAVTTATSPTTTITDVDAFTIANLTTLYKDCTPVTVGGVTYDPRTPVAPGNTEIHLYIPQSGSGTRSFWGTTLGGFNTTTLPSCVKERSVITNALIEEHDGTVVEGDPAGVVPFSIAQWVSQSNGHNDRRHNAVLRKINGIDPTVGGSLNASFPVVREVYNVTKLSRVTSTSADYDAALANFLVGTTSRLCSQSLTIQSYGFATLASAPLGRNCGAVTDALRAFPTV